MQENLGRAVIEPDGSIYDETQENDKFRDEETKLMGLNILRLKNEELSEMNITIEKIISYLNTIV
jgi:very-short-patch-repair endonuclease